MFEVFKRNYIKSRIKYIFYAPFYKALPYLMNDFEYRATTHKLYEILNRKESLLPLILRFSQGSAQFSKKHFSVRLL